MKRKFMTVLLSTNAKNFSKPPKEITVDKPLKTDRMENRAMVKILSLAEGIKVDLEDLMSYRFTEVYLYQFSASMAR